MFPLKTFLRGEQTARPPTSSYINNIVQFEITLCVMDAVGLLSRWTFLEQSETCMFCYLGFVQHFFLQTDLKHPAPGQTSDQLSYLFIATKKTASPGQFNYFKITLDKSV